MTGHRSRTREIIDARLYHTDPEARRRADAVLAELGYRTTDVVELRITDAEIFVDVRVRAGVVRTDTWPIPRRRHP